MSFSFLFQQWMQSLTSSFKLLIWIWGFDHLLLLCSIEQLLELQFYFLKSRSIQESFFSSLLSHKRSSFFGAPNYLSLNSGLRFLLPFNFSKFHSNFNSLNRTVFSRLGGFSSKLFLLFYLISFVSRANTFLIDYSNSWHVSLFF